MDAAGNNYGEQSVFMQKIEDEVAAPDANDLKESTVLLIRHATTPFNVEHQRVIKEHGAESEEFRALKTKTEFIDPPLNETGLAQCSSGSKHVNEIDFKVVFVSPMLRTCETAMELFKNHPNKDKIRFVIYPVAKESAHLCNDFMRGPFKEQIYDKYSDPAKVHGLNYDFQYVYGAYGCESLLQFNVISEIETIKSAYSLVNADEMVDKVGTTNQVIEAVLKQVYEQFPLRIELYEAAYMRAQHCKQFMGMYFKQNPGLLTDPSHKVGIVSHGMFVRCLSASGFDPEKKKIVGAEDMKNCQIYPCKNFKF